MTLSIRNFSFENARLGFIKHCSNVESLMSPVVGTRELTEVDLSRSDGSVDSIENTLIPACAVHT